jgi:PcfJ-like protein
MNESFLPSRFNDEKIGKRDAERRKIDAEIGAALREFDEQPERRAAFEDLLRCVRSNSELLKPAPGQGNTGWLAPVFLLRRLKNLAARRAHWIQPLAAWLPATDSTRLAFRSLAHHLLAFYPVPGFMDSAWDLDSGPEGFRQQAWYIRLGRGASLRELCVPVPLTRRMEHFVRRAPDHYTVGQALRYGEVLGLGGSEQLAREIAKGFLGRIVAPDEFWRTVLHFFAKHPEMPIEYANPIVDFVQANKFGGEEVLTDQGIETRTARWPDVSMDGRTVKSVLRLAEAWHLELGRKKRSGTFSWRKSGIRGFRFLEKGEEHDREWTIAELLDSDALYAEGCARRHCVYTYADVCRTGETTIWSLRLRVKAGEKRMATVEVNPHRRAIIQVRAKCNRLAGPGSIEILRRWAVQEHLQLETVERACG